MNAVYSKLIFFQASSVLKLCQTKVKSMEIKYFNRYSDQVEIEKVYGDSFIRWLYGSAMGKRMAPLLSRTPISHLYGGLQSRLISQRKIIPFIKNFQINMDEFLTEEGRETNVGTRDAYSSFNKFFIRRFKPGQRPFTTDPTKLAAFSEGRYFGYNKVRDDESIPVKGEHITPFGMLVKEKWVNFFDGGPLLISRLCPVDYHRFHYPDDGVVLDHYRISGLLHSVNPIALNKKSDIFITNERQVTILETKNFGKIAYIEVGAMCVGKIVQTSSLTQFRRSDEKGYFLFGASTVIVYGEKDRWEISPDIQANTSKRLETYIKLGDEVARVL